MDLRSVPSSSPPGARGLTFLLKELVNEAATGAFRRLDAWLDGQPLEDAPRAGPFPRSGSDPPVKRARKHAAATAASSPWKKSIR